MNGKLKPELLLRAAENELSKEQPESYLIFLLAIGAGLRRDEIDTLTWDQVIDERLTIRVETNAYTEAKSPESEEEVDVDPKIMEALRSYKIEHSKSVFVLNSRVQPKPSVSSYHHYRCTRHFNNLIKWLREKGIKNRHPIHAMRKEFGSHIAKEKGIYAASVQLRHANIGITRDHYLDKKERATFPIGQMLQDSELQVVSK
jgi:integrase